MAMRNHRRLLLMLATATLVLGTAARAQRDVPTADPAFPRMMYADSLESANDRCIVDPGKPAVLDAGHRARISNDVFFFSSVEARSRFLHDPFRYIQWLSDPVAHTRFHPSKKSTTARREGTRFYFAGPSSRAMFAADPDSFAHARNMMLPATTMP